MLYTELMVYRIYNMFMWHEHADLMNKCTILPFYSMCMSPKKW